MKKIAVAILAFLYVSVASGVMVNIHYCMGDLSSVEYGVEETETCGKCGMKEKKGCCHTEYKFVKLEDAHQMAKSVVDFNNAPVEPVAPYFTADYFHKEAAQLSLNYHSPPDLKDNDIYLQIRVFRI